MIKTDIQLKQDIEAELRWDPKVSATQIDVAVVDGAVSLLGHVENFAQKWAVEQATKRVSGVRTVAHDLTVKLLADDKRTDPEIADAARNALRADIILPKDLGAKVEHARVTLEGEVTWNYQRDCAERAVRHLAGIVDIENAITLKPHATVDEVKEKVSAALHRQARMDTKSIHVETSGGRVTLTGHASSWQSIEDAANAAWAAPGVTESSIT